MTYLLHRVRPLGPFRRVHLSLVAVSVILALALYAGIGLVQAWLERRNEHDRLDLTVRQLEERLAALIPRSAAAPAESLRAEPRPFATSATEAENHAQATLRGLTISAELGGVQIENVHALPPVEEAGLRASRVSANLSVPSASIYELVNILESSTPPLLIESVRIVVRPNSGSDSKESMRGSVQVAIRVYASGVEALPASVTRGVQ